MQNKLNYCVFCGSAFGGSPVYEQAMLALADEMIKNDIGLVFGGSRVGLMGALAGRFTQAGAPVQGVCTRFLAENAPLPPVEGCEITETLPQRKQSMLELADGFIVFPGGVGTLDELFETLAHLQLNQMAKPCGILNTAGYYDTLLAFLGHCQGEGFISPRCFELFLVDDDPARLLRRMGEWRAV